MNNRTRTEEQSLNEQTRAGRQALDEQTRADGQALDEQTRVDGQSLNEQTRAGKQSLDEQRRADGQSLNEQTQAGRQALDDRIWAEEIARRIHMKELCVTARNCNKIPYTAVDGVFDDRSGEDDICWWTNGFWAGMLWQLYHAFGDELYRETAEKIEQKLDRNLMNYMGMDHDTGFKWLLTSVASWKITGNLASKNRAMLAAGNLAGRLNPKAGLIRAWNDPDTADTAGWAIIDCMMNLPLLYWASDQTKDPRFAQIATIHADHARKAFIREDGSVRHIVCFDPDSGMITGDRGGQGMKEGSAWTRGQSWAVYGFTLSYIHTGKKEYLDTAEKVADYVMAHIPENGLVPVDYDQPSDCSWEDDTAAAITACGLLELEQRTGPERTEACHQAAMKLLKTLAAKRCLWDPEIDPLLEKCSAAYDEKEHNYPIIYGDYYFTEAILKLCGREFFMW